MKLIKIELANGKFLINIVPLTKEVPINNNDLTKCYLIVDESDDYSEIIKRCITTMELRLENKTLELNMIKNDFNLARQRFLVDSSSPAHSIF